MVKILFPLSLDFLDGEEVEVADGEEDENEANQSTLVVPQPCWRHLKPSLVQIKAPVGAAGQHAAEIQ